MIFPVLRTSVVRLTAWWICSTTFETQVNCFRISLPGSSRSSWQCPSRFANSPQHVVARLGVCPTWHDMAWHVMSVHFMICHIMSFHGMKFRVMSCHMVTSPGGDMSANCHYLRGTLPVPAQTISSHLKTWNKSRSLWARSYPLAPRYAWCHKSATASRML